MKGFKALMALCGAALLIAGCAVPLGDDYLITRGSNVTYISDYNLQTYVPIPKAGERPVTMVNNRGDLELSVVWKDHIGKILPPFDTFDIDTVYQAEIQVTAKFGYAFYPSTSFTYPKGKITFQNDDLGSPTRIIRVTYNDSRYADITFITDYNLQSYVPIPLAGEEPGVINREGVTVEAVWEVEDPSKGIIPMPAGSFVIGTVYRATIRLRVNPDTHRFAAANFAYPAGTVTTQPNGDGDPLDRDLTPVTYKVTRSPVVINDLNLTPYVPKPINGAMGPSSFAGPQYTGTITWQNTMNRTVQTGPFQAGVEYTAELSLTPAMGYTLTGAGTFIHTGGTVANQANSGTVSIDFLAAAATGETTVVYDTVLTGRIPLPTEGVTPVKGIAGSQYTGTVTWRPSHSTFQKDTVYTAELDLNAVSGYTFAGIGRNVFTHGGAPGAVTNLAGSGRVTIVFPSAASSANPVMSFGPSGNEDSALWLMKEKRNYIYPLSIELPAGPEYIFTGVTLFAGDNSPGEVIINGNNRVLRVKPGALLTVGGGVTLTLRNIRFEGTNGNTTPLFKVWPGGKLILEEGVRLIDNKTDADAGGILVNGGALIINPDVEIKGMAAQRGGGILIDAGGKFIMNGGIIGGALAAEGNTVSAENGGGGVLVVNGSFDMNGGTIQYNRATAGFSGGGACVLAEGSFNLNVGTIKKNVAQGVNSGGGVCFIGEWRTGNFAMNGDAAVIEENTAQGANSGGGVYTDSGEFIINRGTIKKNVAEAGNSGGGVFADNNTNIRMPGGIIVANEALADNSAGGMYLNADIDMFGGIIKENTAWGFNSAGGIYVAGFTKVFRADNMVTVIEGNTAKKANSGGGVYVFDSSFEIYGEGVIKNNTAEGKQSGGGVYIAGAPFSIENGAIKGNHASYSGSDPDSDSGGGVYVAMGSFQNYGGTIGGPDPEDANIAEIGANGVYVNAGRFYLSGTVTGNTKAGTNNYGVYVKNTSYTIYDAFRMGHAAEVTPDNVVFLCDDAMIGLDNYLTGTAPVANIICESPPVSYDSVGGDQTQATKLLIGSTIWASGNQYINNSRNLFWYNGTPVEITDAKSGGGYYYGYYNGTLPITPP